MSEWVSEWLSDQGKDQDKIRISNLSIWKVWCEVLNDKMWGVRWWYNVAGVCVVSVHTTIQHTWYSGRKFSCRSGAGRPHGVTPHQANISVSLVLSRELLGPSRTEPVWVCLSAVCSITQLNSLDWLVRQETNVPPTTVDCTVLCHASVVTSEVAGIDLTTPV